MRSVAQQNVFLQLLVGNVCTCTVSSRQNFEGQVAHDHEGASQGENLSFALADPGTTCRHQTSDLALSRLVSKPFPQAT